MQFNQKNYYIHNIKTYIFFILFDNVDLCIQIDCTCVWLLIFLKLRMKITLPLEDVCQQGRWMTERHRNIILQLPTKAKLQKWDDARLTWRNWGILTKLTPNVIVAHHPKSTPHLLQYPSLEEQCCLEDMMEANEKVVRYTRSWQTKLKSRWWIRMKETNVFKNVTARYE